MRRFYFIRHGTTEWNELKKMQGRRDSGLTAAGLAATHRLARQLAGLRVDVCYASPLGRARQTAGILFGDRGVPIRLLDELAELSFGELEGASLDDFARRHPTAFHALWHWAPGYDPSAFHGESFPSAARRAQDALRQMSATPEGAAIAVVSHGMMLKLIFDVVRGRGPERFWEEPVPGNGEVTEVLMDQDLRALAFSRLALPEDPGDP